MTLKSHRRPLFTSDVALAEARQAFDRISLPGLPVATSLGSGLYLSSRHSSSTPAGIGVALLSGTSVAVGCINAGPVHHIATSVFQAIVS